LPAPGNKGTDKARGREQEAGVRIKIPHMVIREFGTIEEQEAQWLALASLGTEVRVTPPAPRGPETIECMYDVAMCTPWLLEEIRTAEEEGFDAVTILCMADPALYAAREISNIPVVGVGETSFLLAIALGHRFSIMEPISVGVGMHSQVLLSYGLDRFLASVRVLDLTVEEIWADKKKLRDALIREGRKAIEEDRADVIVPGCGFMSGMAKDIERELGVPVIDPWAAAIRFAEMLVSLGLSHSKRAYMIPPPNRREV
jgi:allantoin racemase